MDRLTDTQLDKDSSADRYKDGQTLQIGMKTDRQTLQNPNRGRMEQLEHLSLRKLGSEFMLLLLLSKQESENSCCSCSCCCCCSCSC